MKTGGMSGNKGAAKNKGTKPAAALHAYLQEQLDELEAQLDRVAQGEPDTVHNARLALRRIRSATTTYAKFLPPLPKGDLQQLKKLGRVLGESRDAHVLAGRLEIATGNPGEWRRPAAIRGLATALNTYAASRPQSLVTDAGADEWRRPLRDLRLALQAGPAKSLKRKKTRALLQARWERVQKKLDTTMAEGSDAEHEVALHETRKALKRLRYAVEAVAPAFPASADTFLATCTARQKLLGEHHDAVMAVAGVQRATKSHALDPADSAALEDQHLASARNAEVKFYRVNGRDPLPEPLTALKD